MVSAGGVDREILRDLASGNRRNALPIAIGIAATAVLLAGTVDTRPLIVWVVLAVCDLLRHVRHARVEIASASNPATDRLYVRRNAPHVVSYGLVWGALIPLAAIWGEEIAIWLAAAMLIGVVAMYALAAGPSLRLFALGLASLLLPGLVASAFVGGDELRLSVVIVAFAGVAWVVHTTVHRTLAHANDARVENARLARELSVRLDALDPATELLNRRSFVSGVQRLVDDAYDVERIDVAVGNVRRLSNINELHGDAAGDLLITTIAGRLRANAGERTVVARLGGDEFAVATVVRPGTTVSRAAEVLAAAVEAPVPVDGAQVRVDLHIANVVRSAHHAVGADVVADVISRVAMMRSGPRVSTGSPDSLRRRRELSDRLRAGFDQAGVEPWFQPIVDAGSRGIVAWEALVRWRQPDGSLITPAQFLPVIDLIDGHEELLDVMLRRSLRFLNALDANGAAGAVMHVNVTPTDLRRADIADVVLSHLAEAKLSGERLVLELTEQDIIEIDDAMRASLLHLDAAGVHLAVDDFGTGYSSLSHLVDLPSDHLKIDKRFVNEMGAHASSEMLVRSVVGMATGMGMATVAEGVETESQARALAALGTTHLQGHLFAPALPHDRAMAHAAAAAVPSADV
jgi:diguanylate cyclase (GGDEF)-like protein